MERIAYTVTVKVDGEEKQFPCYADQPVFEAMKRARTGPLSYGCGGGGCGVCRMHVEGAFHAFQPMSRAHVSPEEQAAGTVLLCCIQPRSDLVLTMAKP